MPLHLVTGPANSAKAGAVLDPLRERLDDDPVLVVPSFEDTEHSQRELAETGAVFGARVVRFKRLYELIARSTGYSATVASSLQRRLIVQRAVEECRFELLAASAARPGFARAAERFVVEIEQAMHDSPRFTQALRDWSAGGPHERYAGEVAELYRRYRRRLEAAKLVDEDLFAWRAIEALEADAGEWGRAPVFFYGFDDFSPLELAALETLSAATDVTVSIPWEEGRVAFEPTEKLRSQLLSMGAGELHLEAVSDHYFEASRPALHALERGLYESRDGSADPGAAVRVNVTGGERAELELCGAEVLELLRQGTAPGDIAVVMRDPARYGSLLEQVFGAYGIPYSVDRAVALGLTGLGRGLLALLRSAALDGSAEDLLTYLRTPGFLDVPHLADRLEREVRTKGVATAAGARALWTTWPLDELDALSDARGTRLLELLADRLERLFGGPYERAAHVLAGAELDDARAFRAAHDALTEMTAIVAADSRSAFSARELHDALAELPVRVGENPQPDRVQVAAPGDIRARRFEAVFVCGLQEGEFPTRSRPEAFLGDAERIALAHRTGLTLPLHEDFLARERYLFYVCASRAERLLVLSTRYCDEDGNPQSSSFFLDDARAVFEGGLKATERRRSLGDVTWSLDEAPTHAERARAKALAGPRVTPAPVGPVADPVALAALGSRNTVSASALEAYASCPVKWLVEKVLNPEALEPDPEQMVRGSYAHAVLEQTLRKLGETTGSKRVTAASLPKAERLMLEALEERQGEFRLAPSQTRVRAAVRRLEFDLLRYLRWEASRDTDFEPEHLELKFETELPDGQSVRGIIDRVDTSNGQALVIDYKSGRADRYKASAWQRDKLFQAALYMQVAEQTLGLRAVGGVYAPLSGKDRRARGALDRSAADELGDGYVATDLLAPADFEALNEASRKAIAEVSAGMRSGELCSKADTCAWRGGCSYPSVCRVEGE